jgi:hypothetical protein
MQEAQPTLEQRQPAPKPRDRRALSALRHGLTGQVIILTQADQVAYDKHCKGYHQSLCPEGSLELDLVQYIADDRWRLKRAAAIENSIFADGLTQPDQIVSGNSEVDTALAQARIWIEQGRNFQLLTLYESRIQRRFERNMAELRQLQAQRKAALQQAVEQAALLLELAENKGETYDVEHDFPTEALPPNFVFSTAQIGRLAILHRCLVAARNLSETRRRPRRMVD